MGGTWAVPQVDPQEAVQEGEGKAGAEVTVSGTTSSDSRVSSRSEQHRRSTTSFRMSTMRVRVI